MLITIPIEEVKAGDKFSHNFPGNKFLGEDCENSASIIREAMDVPTTAHLTPGNARTVTKDAVVKRVWVYLDMATYARVKRRKGTMVVVDRAEENKPQVGSESVLELPDGHWLAGRWGSSYCTISWCTCGLSFYGDNREQSDARWSKHSKEAAEPDEYADQPTNFEDRGGAASRKFSYARSQFNQVEDDSEFYRMQIRSNARNAQTKWMNITPAQFRAIRELLMQGEAD